MCPESLLSFGLRRWQRYRLWLCLQSFRICQHVGYRRTLWPSTDLLQRLAGWSHDVPMIGQMQFSRSQLLAIGTVTMLTGACSEVVTVGTDGGRDIPFVDTRIETDRQYTAEELNCRGSICPTGYICVFQCENGVCGPNAYQCRPLPMGCPDPPLCTSTTRPCECPVCLRTLCPPTCTYGNSERNLVDCNP